MSQMNVTQLSGGTVKIVDSTNFPIATTIAAADVTVEPGAIRELHVSALYCHVETYPHCVTKWHPTQDEWSFFMSVTIFYMRSLDSMLL